MTRFERELSGSLGSFWQKEAEKELSRIREDLTSGKITIDESGIARNCIGRVLMSDMLEKLTFVTDKVDKRATESAREVEVARELAEYRANKRAYTTEEIEEMSSAFGPGTTVTDIITGKSITI